MEQAHSIKLGFTNEPFPAGVHICQIFTHEQERDLSLMQFLLSGLRNGERSACFSDEVSFKEIERYFAQHDCSLQDFTEQGAFSHQKTTDVYFENGRFDPDRMLELLRGYYQQSQADGYAFSRVIGEMACEVDQMHGGTRLLEYESRVSMLQRECPVTAVCQYNANKFDGGTIMEIIQVHPMMVVRGNVVHNPFYIPPEDFLAR